MSNCLAPPLFLRLLLPFRKVLCRDVILMNIYISFFFFFFLSGEAWEFSRVCKVCVCKIVLERRG